MKRSEYYKIMHLLASYEEGLDARPTDHEGHDRRCRALEAELVKIAYRKYKISIQDLVSPYPDLSRSRVIDGILKHL